MRGLFRSRSLWMVSGALLLSLGMTAARALRVDIDFDPWDDSNFA
jgi:hypothetical protein